MFDPMNEMFPFLFRYVKGRSKTNEAPKKGRKKKRKRKEEK